MSEEKFREWISSEFEKEAEELEKRLQEHEAADPELAALEMPEDSFDDLMRRIKAEEENKNISKNENGSAKKPFRIRKRTLLAVALPRSWWLQGCRRYRREIIRAEGGKPE